MKITARSCPRLAGCDFSLQRRGRALFRHVSLLLALLMLFSSSGAVADEQDPLAAIGSTLTAATVRIVSGNDTSSGVIVTRDGHVLTVSHGLHSESGKATVVFSDGKSAEALILLQDKMADVAVLKLAVAETPSTTSPIAMLPRSSPAFQIGQCVFAAGYPGREPNGQVPVVRVGVLLGVEQHRLRSSCTLTAGDSGGPLVNHRGELIGLHRQIGLGNESNLHVSFDIIRIAVLPVLDLQSVSASLNPSTTIAERLPVPSDAVVAGLKQRTVRVSHRSDDSTPVALATLLDSTRAVTKLSELTPDAEIFCRFPDEIVCSARVTSTDMKLDVAILTFEQAQENVTPLRSESGERNDHGFQSPWRFIFAARADGSVSRAGLIARKDFSEPTIEGKLGAVLEVRAQAKGVQATEVSPNGTAAMAGLLPGDLITAINDQPPESLDDVARILKSFQPGDWLRFEFTRNAQSQTGRSRLQHDPGERFERTEFLDGRSGMISERRSGFGGVLQHDIPTAPDECGGPICDTSGRIIGITIARRAREASLAIPIEKLLNDK